MIDWTFILNPDTDNIEIDEPVGWADIALEIIRDKRFHGISIAYSVNTFRLVGAGALFLKEQYELHSVDADVKLKIIALCAGEEQDEETFQLDFGRYEETCGEECSVTIGIEEETCFTDFNNNFDKPVDLKSNFAFDGTSQLELYSGLFKNITIPAKALKLQNRAVLNEDNTYALSDDIQWPCDGCINDSWDGYLLPPLPDIEYGSLGSFVPSAATVIMRNCGGNNHPPYPDDVTVNTTELLTGLECGLTDAEISFRAKGNIFQTINDPSGNPGVLLRLKVFKLNVGDDGGTCGTPGDWVELFSQDLIDTRGLGAGTHSFDVEDSLLTTLAQGDLIHYGIYFAVTRVSQLNAVIANFDGGENYFDMSAGAICEDSTADVCLIYETISRVCESITNKCMKIESEYFGRLDSHPDSYEGDGCGSLEALTTGLYLRKAVNPTFFISMNELMKGLQCIHNTGFALKKVDGVDIMKIEGAEYFYQDVLLMDCTDANTIKKRVASEEIPGTILAGYEKWEVEAVNGLDEFNAKREFRLTLRNAKQTFDFRCKFIAGGYAIEITRQQSFAETGAADTRYDNDHFILCLERQGYPYPYVYAYEYDYYISDSYIVEQGKIINEANLFDPDTIINYRISPIRNMMRLAKLFLGSYRDADAANSKIVFSKGEGNFIAEGLINDDNCTPENETMAENEDITTDKFQDGVHATPLLRPENITFEYPMSLADFKRIRANPYGYILHNCGGEEQKAAIMKIVYKPNAGKATMELRNRYQ